MAADDFNRADAATLGANWTDVIGGCSIITNRCGFDASTHNIASYSAETWNPNQEVQATVVGTAMDCGPAVRISATGGGQCYFLVARPGDLRILMFSGGNSYTLVLDCGVVPASGDVLKLTVDGTTLTAFRNGSQVGTATDNTIASGSAGIWGYGTGADRFVDDWSATNISTTPGPYVMPRWNSVRR